MNRKASYKVLSILFFLLFLDVNSQSIKSTVYNDSMLHNYFANPVQGYVTCVGSFAELRRNHFHGGIDIRTGGKVGVPIYASADGYISRINKSAFGYGNTLYIAHPIGYTTVYAHLSKFSDLLENWVEYVHYKQQKFEISVYPFSDEIKVKKGELIGYSGNTGGSSGPHLHFEVRNTINEAPTNPLLFNMDITEKLAPKFLSLYLHSYDEDFIKTDGYLPYSLIGLPAGLSRSVAPGKYGISARIRDYFQSYGENMGINYLEMLVDDKSVFQMSIEQFSFSETRYLNSIMDFAMYKKNGSMAYRFWKDEGNLLPWYASKSKEYGIIEILPQQITPLKITLKAFDVNMKEASISFFLKADVSAISNVIKRNKAPNYPFIDYSSDFTFTSSTACMWLPANTIYNSMYFKHQIRNNQYGASIDIFDNFIPLHKLIKIGLQIDSTLSVNKDKLYIFYQNGANKACETKRQGNWLFAEAKETGNFQIALDETPPYIHLVANNGKGYFAFTISDGGTGIKSYNAYIDGKWLLMDFDGKSGRLTGTAGKKRYGEGKHNFELRVTDKAGNTRSYMGTCML